MRNLELKIDRNENEASLTKGVMASVIFPSSSVFFVIFNHLLFLAAFFMKPFMSSYTFSLVSFHLSPTCQDDQITFFSFIKKITKKTKQSATYVRYVAKETECHIVWMSVIVGWAAEYVILFQELQKFSTILEFDFQGKEKIKSGNKKWSESIQKNLLSSTWESNLK